MGRVTRKPVFGVSVKASFKPVSSAKETILKIEISPVASLHMKLSKKRLTKTLISLRECANWSAPVLFANPRRQVFSRPGPNKPGHRVLARTCIVFARKEGLYAHNRLSPKVSSSTR